MMTMLPLIFFVPMATKTQTEQQAVHSILHPSPSQVISWPPIGDTPINEFTTVRYISCAFFLLVLQSYWHHNIAL